MGHESDGDTNCNWYIHLRIAKETGGFGNKWKNRDHPNYDIGIIGQNTEKSPGDLRRLPVTQTPVINHQLKLVWKSLKWVMIIIMIIIRIVDLVTVNKIMRTCRSGGLQSENKRNLKRGRHLDFTRKLKNKQTRKHESDGDAYCNCYVQNDAQRLGKGAERIVNLTQNYNIVEVSQNTEKKPRNLV